MAKKLTSTKARKILHDKEVHGHPLTEQQRKFFGAIAGGAKPYKAESGGWLDKYDAPQAQNGIEGTMGGLTDKGFNFNPAWGGAWRDGGNLPKAQKGIQSSADSVRHQANKILQYEQLRGGPGGTPLPYYNDPKYMNMLMGNIYPEVKKILPNASAMEAGEAMDFIFNAGWDQAGNKILKDPRAYALQEYYKQYDPSKLDAEGKWSGRKNAPYSFDQEYNATIGKLPENERRVLMNKGRDWYYKNINNPSPGVPNSNYYDTWYGRIWNTNDFQPFNLNNPKFIPKKQTGGVLQPPMAGANTSVSMAQLGDSVKPIPMQLAMGGSLPGAVGFTYARTQSPAPANGPYAKKTKASAQNGQEMKYYQAGLDFKPKTISQDGSDIPVDPMGYWNPENVGSPVIIPSNVITMEGVDQPLLGISDTGDVQYMEPGEDYEFDGEYVTEYPVAQKGKTIPAPTTADSLRIYNMQLAQNAYYKKFKDAFENQEVESYYDDLYNDPNSGMSIDKNPSQSLYTYREVLKSAERSPDVWLSDIKKWHNVNNQQAKQMIANSLAGTKQYNKDPNIIYYKDLITPRIDPVAPFSIYDKRIKPQGIIKRTPKIGANFPGENVNTFYYDPLAVKPYHMRTPKEKIEWEKKYGKKETTKAKPTPKPTVTPQKDKKIITGSKKEFDKYNNESPLILDKDGIYRNDMGIAFRFEKPTPPPVKKKVVTPAPEPVKESKVIPVTPEAVRKTILSTVPSGGMGIFGPGNTRIGEYDESTNTFYPDYENLAGRKKVNQPDIDLLADQEKLSNFITSKTGKKPKINVKQRNGGVNKADEYPIEKLDQLLNFTNYNKPTKGGWLDKYN